MLSPSHPDSAPPRLSPHLVAILQALLVTFLWSLSWVFIKIGLGDENQVPPVTFAALRYLLAAVCILPFVVTNPRSMELIRGFTPRHWLGLAVLGTLYYTATQGMQYVALSVLPAATLTLILAMTPLIVGIAGQRSLGEQLTGKQWLGLALALGGTVVYFFPIELSPNQTLGVVFGVLSLLSNSTSALLGRRINQVIPAPLVVTGVSMGIGAVLMMGIGVAVEGFVTLSWQVWGIVILLAVVNTAFAFTLWNHTLRTLPAIESSVINNTMSIQIPILAFVFLNEMLTTRQIAGLVLSVIGILVVQLGRKVIINTTTTPTE